MTLTRRQVLSGAAAAGGSIAAGTLLGTPGARAAARVLARAGAVPPQGSTLEAIEHIVILIQENRSFDHYFGSFRGVRGFSDPDVLREPGGQPIFAQPGYRGSVKNYPGYLLPYRLNTQTEDAYCTPDITHNWAPQHLSYNGGLMNGFAAQHLVNDSTEAAAGTMGYYTRADIPFYYALADNFTILDGYHCSVMGPTDPNRLMSVSATIDPAGVAGGPICKTETPPSQLKWKTMMEALEDAEVGWKIYQSQAAVDAQEAAGPFNAESNNIVAYFENFQSPTSPLFQKAFTPVFPNDLASDVKNDTLPSVSWVLFESIQETDEHPSSPPTWGEASVQQLVATLSANPAVWAKTLLIITYDENGGFFDHVAPPVAPAGTTGEFVTTNPLPAAAAGIAGPIGLGFRVPTLLVSPFTKGGWVCSDTFDHTSLLRLIETRFGVTVPNLSAWRRSVTGDLTSALGANVAPDTTVPAMPVASLQDPTVNRECDTSSTQENPTAVPYQVPAMQGFPQQEPGTLNRRGGLPGEPGADATVQYFRRLKLSMGTVQPQAATVRVRALTLSGSLVTTVELWHGARKLASHAATLTPSAQHVTLRPAKRLGKGAYRICVRVGGQLVLNHPFTVA